MSPVVARQMFTAEVLKLRRNRALMAFAGVLTIGTVVLLFGYPAIRHASDPQYGPAGGTEAFDRAVRMLGLYLGALGAILIGAEAGTADLSSGVFRDLVATGRSRLALFCIRAPAAIAVTLVFGAVAFGLAIAGTFALAGGLATPTLSHIVISAGWIVLAIVLMTSLAVSIGSLTGSRALTLTGVIGWQVLVSELLLHITSLGSARDGLLTVSLGRLMPFPNGLGVALGAGLAVAITAAWLLVPAGLGAWRTQTRDA